MITRKTYIITRNMTNEHHYSVEAESKAEAIRMVEEGEVYSEEQYFVRETKPIVTDVIRHTHCPNKGEGWSDIPLIELVSMNLGDFGWHYNGICEGERETTESHCYTCNHAMQNGLRLLTNAEKEYLNSQYNKGLNLGMNA